MASLLATGISTLPPQSSLGRTETPKAFHPKSKTLKPPYLKVRNFNISAHIGGDSATLHSAQPSKSSSSSSFGHNLSVPSDNIVVDELDSGDESEFDGLEYQYRVDTDDEDNVDSFVTMAVPKKRTSHTKTKIRKNHWKRKAKVAAKKAFSLGKSIATGRSKSFFVPQTTEKPTTS